MTCRRCKSRDAVGGNPALRARCADSRRGDRARCLSRGTPSQCVAVPRQCCATFPRSIIMLKRTYAAALVGCILVAGCATMHPSVQRSAKKLDCDGSSACAVTVTVECLHYFGCDISVDYDLVFIS